MKSARQSIYRIPILGYVARWIAGFVRLPDRFSSYDAQLLAFREAEASLRVSLEAFGQNVGEISRAVADARAQAGAVRGAFDQHLPAFLNVISSSQSALRLLRREQEALRDKVRESSLAAGDSHAELEKGLAETNARADSLESAFAALSSRLATAESAIPETANRVEAYAKDAQSRFAGLSADAAGHASSVREELDSVREELDAIGARSRELDDHRESLSYLLGRVEFVRRELLFELRYGADSGRGAAPAKAKILNTRKVKSALREGLRLNVGCGHLPMQGYVNVDLRDLPGVDVLAEATDLPFEPGSVREIFSSHLLEHFPQEQLVRQVLPYWRELLGSDGILRAVVPDAQAMIAQYGKGAYPYDDLREVLYGGQDYDGDFHFNMFTPESLGQILGSAGFSSYEVIAAGRQNGRCYEFEAQARAATA